MLATFLSGLAMPTLVVFEKRKHLFTPIEAMLATTREHMPPWRTWLECTRNAVPIDVHPIEGSLALVIVNRSFEVNRPFAVTFPVHALAPSQPLALGPAHAIPFLDRGHRLVKRGWTEKTVVPAQCVHD